MELSLPATSIEELNRLQLGLRILLFSCSNLDLVTQTRIGTRRPTHKSWAMINA